MGFMILIAMALTGCTGQRNVIVKNAKLSEVYKKVVNAVILNNNQVTYQDENYQVMQVYFGSVHVEGSTNTNGSVDSDGNFHASTYKSNDIDIIHKASLEFIPEGNDVRIAIVYSGNLRTGEYATAILDRLKKSYKIIDADSGSEL